MSHESIKIAWNTADIAWNDNDNFWNEVIDIIQHGGKRKGWNKYDKDKKKRRKVIKLVMFRKGIKVYDEEKEIQNIEIYLDDIKLIAEEIKRNVQIIHG